MTRIFNRLAVCLLVWTTLLFAQQSIQGQQSEPTKSATKFDKEKLSQLTSDIESGTFTNTHAVLIVQNGKRLYEQYFRGTDETLGRSIGKRLMDSKSLHDLRSVTKSVTAILVGIALADEEKKVDFASAVEKPIGSYLPAIELGVAQKKISLHHVLSMTTGLKWNEMDSNYRDQKNDAIRLYSVSDPSQYVLSRPVIHEPGSTWYYNGGCTHVLGEFIRVRSGKDLKTFATEKLFTPIGITDFEWHGNGQWKSGNQNAAAGLLLSCRDLAKIGTLVLNGGKWNGKQIVPKSWIERTMTRHVKTIGKWSGGGIWGYGYQWRIGKLPSGEVIYSAAGNGNQRLFVIPKYQLSVAIFAGEYNKPFKPHSEMILKRILEARN